MVAIIMVMVWVMAITMAMVLVMLVMVNPQTAHYDQCGKWPSGFSHRIHLQIYSGAHREECAVFSKPGGILNSVKSNPEGQVNIFISISLNINIHINIIKRNPGGRVEAKADQDIALSEGFHTDCIFYQKVAKIFHNSESYQSIFHH